MGSSEVVSQSRMDNAKSVVKDLNPFTYTTERNNRHCLGKI